MTDAAAREERRGTSWREGDLLEGSRILITGGTGSFGTAFVRHALQHLNPSELVIFSRDEFKQHQMAQQWSPPDHPVRYFLGDIRDKQRLLRALNGVDYVIHAAALKHVPALEENPFEAIQTNIIGAQNIIEAALERNVKRVVAISTDKAVSPINLYGATKLCMEKLLVAANAYVRYRDIRFAVVRYGNVVGSRGSVIPLFAGLVAEGCRDLPVTDPEMTRFWITLDQGIELVISALENAESGETFVPKIPSMRMRDLVAAMPDECTFRVVGKRPGEKVHEVLISESEGARTFDRGSYYVIRPESSTVDTGAGAPVRAGFSYESQDNTEWVTEDDMRDMIRRLSDERSGPPQGRAGRRH